MFKELKIDQIKSNPNNPRTIFEGQKFDDLIKSIKEKGVLEPILVRPVNGKFEIVAGERRYRAMLQISGEKQPESGGIFEQSGMIPAIIRKINDDEAFEIMIIENLQREDLTPLEEIQSFEKYVKKHGKDGIILLGEKTGIQPAYIRRRIAVLKLPEKALKAWNKEKLTFGHLEELIRLKDTKKLKEVLDRILGPYSRDMTVRDLREYINSMIPLLSKAQFDKTDCRDCMYASDVQKNLWDIEAMKKVHCLNPKCFMEKQIDYLTNNWSETSWAKQFKTTGFVFEMNLSHNDRNYFSYSKPFKKCLEGCKDFKTVINNDGTLGEGQACIKNKSCFQSLSRLKAQKEARKEGAKKIDEGGVEDPRKPWHGQHFRELFFQKKLPEKFQGLQPDDVKVLRAALYALIKMKWRLRSLFIDLSGVKHEDHWSKESDNFGAIAKMKKDELLQIIKELSLQVILGNDMETEGRQLVADHIGIDLAKEWEPTNEYYNLKTIRELLEYGEKLGILKDKKAEKFLKNTLKRKKFSACKKSELVQLFKESGINLIGKVPDEILGEKKT